MEDKTPVQKVVDIFIDYYGEDKVDLRGDTIMVYFPHVTITNEHDRSIDISELYAKVVIDPQGTIIGTFTLNRSEYTVEQWLSDYMHSHVNRIPKNNLLTFKTSCLGDGPIKGTMAVLSQRFDEDIWRLFVLELDKYVHTESLDGGPYHRLENVGVYSEGSRYRRVAIPLPCDCAPHDEAQDILVKRFLPYVIRKRVLSFCFTDYYDIADSPLNIVIKFSNLFIEWYNSLSVEQQGSIRRDFTCNGTLLYCKVENMALYEFTSNNNYNASMLREMIGTDLWIFKGRRVKLNITGISDPDTPPTDENLSIILHPDRVMTLVYKMLKVINYRYGTESSIDPNKEIRYL